MIDGTGFPVTFAFNLIVPFSLTVISWNLFMNNGGSAFSSVGSEKMLMLSMWRQKKTKIAFQFKLKNLPSMVMTALVSVDPSELTALRV